MALFLSLLLEMYRLKENAWDAHYSFCPLSHSLYFSSCFFFRLFAFNVVNWKCSTTFIPQSCIRLQTQFNIIGQNEKEKLEIRQNFFTRTNEFEYFGIVWMNVLHIYLFRYSNLVVFSLNSFPMFVFGLLVDSIVYFFYFSICSFIFFPPNFSPIFHHFPYFNSFNTSTLRHAISFVIWSIS